MKIFRASIKDLYLIKNIVHSTINQIYPNYYPHSVVDFFLNYHCEENIKAALNNEYVLLMECEGNIVGTGSLNANEICRMFILPQYQGCGYGTTLLETLEKHAFENECTSVVLDASLPAYGLYEKRGYISIKYNKITTPQGQVLCYNKMEKALENSDLFYSSLEGNYEQ